MDLVALDITDLGGALPVPGEMVEILGPSISVDDQADAADTIGYEILTSLRGRYQRTYVDSMEEEPLPPPAPEAYREPEDSERAAPGAPPPGEPEAGAREADPYRPEPSPEGAAAE